MQQQALEQAYLRIAQQKAQVEGPEVQARTGLIDTQRQAAQQNIGRQGQMDDLARQVAGNMFQKQVPGGVGNLMGGGVTAPMEGQSLPYGGGVMQDGASPTNVGPSMQNASALNQGDLVRNATQLMAMNDPNSLERMSHGVNVPRGAINVNQLTGEQTQGMPPAQSQAYYGMTPYQSEQVQMQRERLGLSQDNSNRRMDAYDRKNLSAVHKLASDLYNKLGELDKAKEEAALVDDDGSGGNEEISDGSKQRDLNSPDAALYATNPQTKQRIKSIDGGKTWQPAN